ncbi:MAG: hypothetical protein HY079_07750 [Elusimicrobia bacterium]|nr:hypothetical protein [Elusimicrobiota bacterium]
MALAAPAFAGGDYVAGRITTFSGKAGHYKMHFVQTAKTEALLRGCPEFDVSIDFKRVPALPLGQSSNPSQKQTIAAAEYLQKAQTSGREINFGYMGSGLIPTGKTCSFSSFGLMLMDDREKGKEKTKEFVLAFHDQV